MEVVAAAVVKTTRPPTTRRQRLPLNPQILLACCEAWAWKMRMMEAVERKWRVAAQRRAECGGQEMARRRGWAEGLGGARMAWRWAMDVGRG